MESTKTTTSFAYTDQLSDFDSEAVEFAVYNERHQSLVVGLWESGKAYLYERVPSRVWHEFKAAPSKGGYYARVIKSHYGPAMNLGWADEINFVDTNEEKSVPAPDMGNFLEAKGTPKDLTYADDAVVTAFPLTSPTPVGVKFKHEIVFEHDDAERSYTTEAGSVTEALSILDEISEMLDLSFKVKRVVVHFE